MHHSSREEKGVVRQFGPTNSVSYEQVRERNAETLVQLQYTTYDTM